MPDDLDLIYMSASEQLRQFRAGTISPLDVLDAQIARAETVEPKINAFAWRFFDEARDIAKRAADRYARGQARPLEGITLAVKDDTDVEGKVTTSGSKLFLDFVAPTSHPMVQRLVDAGAIVHAKTTVPEFCLSGITKSALFGVTRNPWNIEYTPSGSSGGAGASLAAGTTTIATGSDSGGSIRLPASVNGVYGFKAPFGRFPTVVPWGMVPQSVYGPMARSVGDLALMYDISNGPASYDHTALRKETLPAPLPSVAGMRIAYSPDLGFAQIDPEVRSNTERALKHFESLGVTVEQVTLNWTEEKVIAATHGTMLTGFWRTFLEAAEAQTTAPDDISDHTRAMIAKARKLPAGAMEAAASILAEMASDIDAIYRAGFDAIICPTTGLPSVSAVNEPLKDKIIINNVEVDSMMGWWLTHPFNLLYLHPIIVAQTGRSASNIPTSIQIIAGRYDDATAFALASAYEQVAPQLYAGAAFPDFRGTI